MPRAVSIDFWSYAYDAPTKNVVYGAYCHVRNACMALMLAWPMRICNDCLPNRASAWLALVRCFALRCAVCVCQGSLPCGMCAAFVLKWPCGQTSFPMWGCHRGRAAAVLEDVPVSMMLLYQMYTMVYSMFLVMANCEAIINDYNTV